MRLVLLLALGCSSSSPAHNCGRHHDMLCCSLQQSMGTSCTTGTTCSDDSATFLCVCSTFDNKWACNPLVNNDLAVTSRD